MGLGHTSEAMNVILFINYIYVMQDLEHTVVWEIVDSENISWVIAGLVNQTLFWDGVYWLEISEIPIIFGSQESTTFVNVERTSVIDLMHHCMDDVEKQTSLRKAHVWSVKM